MAIDQIQWNQILASGCKGRALSAGFPDLLVPFAGLGFRPERQLTVRRDSKALQGHHTWGHDIFDSREVFAGIGLELDVIDRERHEGSERLYDLNMEPHEGDAAFDAPPYDLVIDPGTSEHCFNIPQALVNLASAVKLGGCISQALPMAMFNHGYWNINPVALLDFYEQNGFKIEEYVLRSGDKIFSPVGRARYTAVPDGAVNVILARRLEIQPFRWPQQQAKLESASAT